MDSMRRFNEKEGAEVKERPCEGCAVSVSYAPSLAEVESMLVSSPVGAHLKTDDGLAFAKLVLAEVSGIVLGLLHANHRSLEPLLPGLHRTQRKQMETFLFYLFIYLHSIYSLRENRGVLLG